MRKVRSHTVRTQTIRSSRPDLWAPRGGQTHKNSLHPNRPQWFHSFHFSLYLIYYQSLSLLDISHHHTNMSSISHIFTSFFWSHIFIWLQAYSSAFLRKETQRSLSAHMPFTSSPLILLLTCSLLVNIRDDLHLVKSNEDVPMLSSNP